MRIFASMTDIRHAVLPPALPHGMMQAMNIAKLRKIRGLTKVDLAEMIGTTQPTISRAERGDGGVTLDVLRACAEALEVTLSDLFADDRAAAHQALLDAFDNLPQARQQVWLAMADLAQKEAALEAARKRSEAEQK